VLGWVFHLRVAGLLSVLGILDYLLIMYAYQSTLAKGATVQLVFGFEYAILITMVINTMIKYVLHAAELRSETPWENKAVFLLYTELVVGLIRVILYIVFVFLMVKIYTLPLFAFRPMYYTIRYAHSFLISFFLILILVNLNFIEISRRRSTMSFYRVVQYTI
jgi:E3 ubiquitin-protein ligase synoviolin